MFTTNLSPHSIKEIIFLMVWGGIISLLASAYLFILKGRTTQGRTTRSTHRQFEAPRTTSTITENTIFTRKKELFLGASILVPFILFYIFLLLYKQDFVGYDNSVLTFYSTRGNPHPMPIWASSGRFWPLGHQEFNLISLLSTAPLAYHLLSAIQLLIALAITFFVMNNVGVIARVLIILAIIVQPNVVTVFFGLIYPERNIIFWLPILIACIQKFRQKAPLWAFLGALISAQFIIYYKEPAFALVGGFAAGSLALAYLQHSRPWQWKTLTAVLKREWLYTSIALMSSVYLLFYAIAVIPNTETAYTSDKNIDFTMSATLVEYFKADIILPIFLAFCLARGVYCCTRKSSLKRSLQTSVDPVWDCVALGAVLYFFAYVAIKLFRPHVH
ncbi:MAG: hypothetical protein AAFP03_05745 [Cyanobacteria bacterium J06598_3]